MAYAFVQDTSSTTAGGTISAGSITVTAGNCLVIVVHGNLDAQPTTYSGNGNTYNYVGHAPNHLHFAYVLNANGGATNVSVTGGSTNYDGIYVAEYSGIAAASALLGSAFATQNGGKTGGGAGHDTDGVSTGTVAVTVSGGALVWGFMYDLAGTSNGLNVAGSNFTPRTLCWAALGGSGTHNAGFPEDRRVQTSGSYAATWTADVGNQFDTFVDGALILAETNVGPMIGQTTPPSGSTNLGTVAGDMYWITSPAYASGTATSLNVGIQSFGSATALLLGLYDRNGNLLASGTVASPAVGINTATISATPITYGLNYSISVQATTNVGLPSVASNNTGTGPFHATNTPNTVPSTLNASPFVDGHGLMTLYASGQLGSGALGTPLGGLARTQVHFRGSGMTS